MMMMVILLLTSHCRGASTSLMGNDSTASILLAHQYPELELLSDAEPTRRILRFNVFDTLMAKKPACFNNCKGPKSGQPDPCGMYKKSCHQVKPN